MSISAAGDIVADVLKNADAGRRDLAHAKLAASAPDGSPESIAATKGGSSFATAVLSQGLRMPSGGASGATKKTEGSASEKALDGLKEVLLTRYVEEMMPKTSTLFHDSAGDPIWKGFFAQAIAHQLIASGAMEQRRPGDARHGRRAAGDGVSEERRFHAPDQATGPLRIDRKA